MQYIQSYMYNNTLFALILKMCVCVRTHFVYFVDKVIRSSTYLN